MIVKENSGGGDFEQPPTGTHVARCVRLIDLGTQTSEFQGQPKIRREVIIAWELPEELMSEGDFAGQPFMVSKFYTLSLHEKANLRADLVNWRGRDFNETELEGFDLRTILGHLCQVVLTMNDKNKARVTGLASVPRSLDKQAPSLAQVNPTLYFSLDEFDENVFASLSDGYRRMITVSPEYQAILTDRDADMKHEDAKEPDGSESFEEWAHAEDPDPTIPF